MKINVYPTYNQGKPVRTNKFVKNMAEADSFCEWYKKTYGTSVNYVIVR